MQAVGEEAVVPRLETLLEALSTGIGATDAGGRIVWANASLEALSGASRQKLLGLHFRILFPDAEEWLGKLLAGHEGDPGARPPLTIRTHLVSPVDPGARREVRLSATCVSGSPGLILEVSDLSSELAAESEARQVGLSETSRQVLRNLAHEIKNPLGGIRGAAQLLEPELEDPGLREYTEVIISEADRLQNLVDRLLAPYRSKRKIQEVNIHEILERVASLLTAEFPSGLSLVRDYDVSAPSLRGDREQLLQVFLNIGKNAAEALGPKIAEGTAEIRITTRVARQVQIGLRRCRLALLVHVADNGPGIPPEIRERIFYPLVTGKPNGSGLGLSLAQNFIRQQGGTISVESRPGNTDFSILFPLDSGAGREEK